MIRTQIYLTVEQKRALEEHAGRTGQTQSALIREAIDRWLDRLSPLRRADRLRGAFGLWEGREDLPDLRAVRRELDRSRVELARASEQAASEQAASEQAAG